MNASRSWALYAFTWRSTASSTGCANSGMLSDVRGGRLRGHELLKSGLVADWVEVRIALGEGPEELRHLDRALEVLERVSRPAGQALDAGDVVEQVRVLGMSLEQLPPAVCRLGVLAGLVERYQRCPELRGVAVRRGRQGDPGVAS